MKKDYQKLFNTLKTKEPSKELFEGILLRVETEDVRQARTRLGFLGVVSLTSFVALVPAFQYALNGFYQSGFYQYFSLLFSDGATLLPYWKEFAFSLIETLPIVEITAFLIVVLILLESTKSVIKNARTAFYQFSI
jgi:hypothetical protein